MKRHNYNIAIAIAISCILFLINGYHNYIKDQRKENLEKYKAGYYDNVTVKNKNIVPNTTKNYVPPKNWTKYIIANAFSISVPPTVELRQSNDLLSEVTKRVYSIGNERVLVAHYGNRLRISKLSTALFFCALRNLQRTLHMQK